MKFVGPTLSSNKLANSTSMEKENHTQEDHIKHGESSI